ncbi:molybdopterin-dependent oxidoreductase [Acidobacteria bacterium AH-259-D05]|nr:molybdopterin-dependent oxidoreductase [Acidobacteria bacterium AH-259-D05]
MTEQASLKFTRRDLVKGGGALVITFAIPKWLVPQIPGAASLSRPPLSPDQLDSYLRIGVDGRVTVFFGKMDMGQGVDTAIAQIVADELDVPFERVGVLMSDTDFTVDQGGASGSTGIRSGAVPLRNAAAEARRVLLDWASESFGVPAEGLTVTDGIIQVKGDPSKILTYEELIGGKYFNVTMEWNQRYGNSLNAKGEAEPKTPDQYKIVGKSIPRIDVPGKILGQTTYVTDIKVEGMWHGRVIRPPIAGATPTGFDENSISDIADAKVVRLKDFIGVVAEDEWSAIKAARQLKVTWSEVEPPFPKMEDLYDYIRRTPHVEENAGRGSDPNIPIDEGVLDKPFDGAVRIIEAEYEHPFQSHACMGPACVVADVQPDQVTVWTGSQKAHKTREGVAKLLELPTDKVRAIWAPGPGSYGRNDAGDAAMDAALFSRAVGKPVRVQGMRHEGHGWDPKGPASVIRLRAGLDAEGNVVGHRFRAKGFSAWDVRSNESSPSDTLAGLLVGWPKKTRHNYGVPSESYNFPNKLKFWQTIPPFLEKASPLRTAHFRDPQGPQIHFASESFIDELATAVGQDPVEFRLRYLSDARDIAVVKAAAKRAGWESRTSPKSDGKSGEVLTGRGMAYASRGGTTVAVVAEVEVNPETGRVWAKRFVVAHDCGLIINPDGLKRTIEGNIVQAMSRALKEEVTFDRNQVTSIDWRTYPIVESTDAPESIDVVLINRPDVAPTGAGEPTTRSVAAAIANAIFDATGRRLRRVPFTPERVKASLA